MTWQKKIGKRLKQAALLKQTNNIQMSNEHEHCPLYHYSSEDWEL